MQQYQPYPSAKSLKLFTAIHKLFTLVVRMSARLMVTGLIRAMFSGFDIWFAESVITDYRYRSLFPNYQPSMKPEPKEGMNNLIFGEIQLLLAEKRTAL